MSTLSDSLKDWVEPEGYLGIKDIRRLARERIIAAALPVVLDEWRNDIPEGREEDVTIAVVKGTKIAISFLLATKPQPKDVLSEVLLGLESYWEPPLASVSEEGIPEIQRRAYRWSASIVARFIRDALEPLHQASAFNTSEAAMPALNRRMRGRIYDEYLLNPHVAWRLSRFTMLALIAHEQTGGDLPSVAR